MTNTVQVRRWCFAVVVVACCFVACHGLVVVGESSLPTSDSDGNTNILERAQQQQQQGQQRILKKRSSKKKSKSQKSSKKSSGNSKKSNKTESDEPKSSHKKSAKMETAVKSSSSNMGSARSKVASSSSSSAAAVTPAETKPLPLTSWTGMLAVAATLLCAALVVQCSRMKSSLRKEGSRGAYKPVAETELTQMGDDDDDGMDDEYGDVGNNDTDDDDDVFINSNSKTGRRAQ